MQEDLKLLSKWTARLWQIYTHYFDIELTDADADELLEQTKQVWEESNENELITDMIVAFTNDIERRNMCKNRLGS